METNAASAEYVVKPGDTLAGIAQKVYGGDAAAAQLHLYNNNRGKVDMSGTIYPGTVLQLPTFER